MPRCGKCGGNVDVRYAYWKGDEARHRICPRRGKRVWGKATVRKKYSRDIEATLRARFEDERSYVASDGREILYELDWQNRVKEVFERDGYMCHWKIETTIEPSRESFNGVAAYKIVICGKPADHPHHVMRRGIRHDDRMSNLIAICAEHHREAHPEKQTRFTKRKR